MCQICSQSDTKVLSRGFPCNRLAATSRRFDEAYILYKYLERPPVFRICSATRVLILFCSPSNKIDIRIPLPNSDIQPF